MHCNINIEGQDVCNMPTRQRIEKFRAGQGAYRSAMSCDLPHHHQSVRKELRCGLQGTKQRVTSTCPHWPDIDRRNICVVVCERY